MIRAPTFSEEQRRQLAAVEERRLSPEEFVAILLDRWTRAREPR